MNKKFEKYLGVDWGEKRIGLALGDSETNMASPFKVVGDMDEMLKIIKDENIDMVVVGEPLKMKNRNLEPDGRYLDFLEALKKKVDIPVEVIDERLTSVGSDKLVGDKKTKAPRDAVAAMLILQMYIDTKETKRNEKNE